MEYSTTVRRVFDLLADETCDAETAKEFLLSHLTAQHQLKLISTQHFKRAVEQLPKPPTRGRGRPKKALGSGTYDRKYKLYLDWIYERTLDPSLTKEQFAKKRLGITDQEHRDSNSAHARVDALLQDLKPARMKYLDEGQRRALDELHPVVIAQDRTRWAREWREAKQSDPELTKEEFVRSELKWVAGEIDQDVIRQQVEYLEQGERLLDSSERR